MRAGAVVVKMGLRHVSERFRAERMP
jgi:hypothetical protein